MSGGGHSFESGDIPEAYAFQQSSIDLTSTIVSMGFTGASGSISGASFQRNVDYIFRADESLSRDDLTEAWVFRVGQESLCDVRRATTPVEVEGLIGPQPLFGNAFLMTPLQQAGLIAQPRPGEPLVSPLIVLRTHYDRGTPHSRKGLKSSKTSRNPHESASSSQPALKTSKTSEARDSSDLRSRTPPTPLLFDPSPKSPFPPHLLFSFSLA
jgi:hypothetical protein